MKKIAVAMLTMLCLLFSGCAQKAQEESAQAGYIPPEVVGSGTQTDEKENLIQQNQTTQTEIKPVETELEDYSGRFPVATEQYSFTVFNLNLNNENGAGDQSYASRYKLLMDLLLEQNPDVITFQEVGSGWMDYLVPSLKSSYEYYLIYPNAADITTANPIFYKTEKFEQVYGGCFWISDTPDEQSASSDGKYYNCTWLQLKEKATEKKVYFFNSQLSEAVAPKAAEILDQKRDDLGWREPVVCSIDLGAPLTIDAGETLLKTFSNAGDGNSTPTSYALGAAGAIHDFSLYSKVTLTPASYRVITGKNVSDHNPMITKFTINTETLNYADEFVF